MVANVYGNEFTKIRPRRRTFPPTAKHENDLGQVRDCATFMQSYRSYACNFFGNRIGMKSSYNLAMTNLMGNFNIDYVLSTITPNYPGVLFSKGNLLSPVANPMTLPTPATLEISWQKNSCTNPQREMDQAQILITADLELNSLLRKLVTYTVNLPVHLQGKTLHVWLAFKNEDETNASNSIYLVLFLQMPDAITAAANSFC